MIRDLKSLQITDDQPLQEKDRLTTNFLRRKNFDAKIDTNSSQNDEDSLFDFLATNSSQKIARKDFSSQKKLFCEKNCDQINFPRKKL